MNDFMLNYGLVLIGLLITVVAEIFVKLTYNKYRTKSNGNNLSGFEVARKILDNNKLERIHIVETKGLLTDHYDPTRKVIKLSPDIFNGTTIAATSIAAHEVGHALQDKDGYFFLKFRSGLFPLASFGSKFGYIAVIIGLLLGYSDLAWLGIALLMFILLFQLVTLPVEFNASTRAKQQIKELSLIDIKKSEGVDIMLKAAALTYVASLVTTLLQILRLVLILTNRRD
jgi:uncharacterized protein